MSLLAVRGCQHAGALFDPCMQYTVQAKQPIDIQCYQGAVECLILPISTLHLGVTLCYRRSTYQKAATNVC